MRRAGIGGNKAVAAAYRTECGGLSGNAIAATVVAANSRFRLVVMFYPVNFCRTFGPGHSDRLPSPPTQRSHLPGCRSCTPAPTSKLLTGSMREVRGL